MTILFLIFLLWIPLDGLSEPTDMDGDGFPDTAELIDETDRSRFRRRFTSIAESQFYNIHPHWPEIRRDCTGLVCFAYKEALKIHNTQWLKRFKYLTDPTTPDIHAFQYPNIPLIGTNLFRTQPGPFTPEDLDGTTFQPVATAQVLMQYNCRFLGKEPDDTIKAGDLLFYRYFVDEHLVHHTMVLVKTFPGPHNTTDGTVVYHTGPDGNHSGEVRKLRLSTLNRHPDDIWHAKPNNPHFLGFYRFNILDYHYASGGQGAFLKNRPLDPRKTFYKKNFVSLCLSGEKNGGITYD